MSTPFGSIRNLLVVVSVVAADCYLLHDFLADDTYLPFDGWPLPFRLGFAGSALMANLVVVGGSMILPRRVGERPFLTGFVVAGAFSILVMQGVALVIPWDWFVPLHKAINDRSASLHRICGFGLRYADFLDASVVAVFGALCLLPELLIATAGGLAARSYSRMRSDAHAASADHTDRTGLRIQLP